MEAKRFYEEVIELYKRFKELCLVAKDNGWYNVEMEKSKVHLQGSFEEIKESMDGYELSQITDDSVFLCKIDGLFRKTAVRKYYSPEELIEIMKNIK